MSAQFGICNLDGRPADGTTLDKARLLLAPYGPDYEGSKRQANVAMLYRALYTTREDRGEIQPHISCTGATIMWDGRLDNRDELLRLFPQTDSSSTDVEIVATAFDKLGTSSFACLVGDWALSIWDVRTQTLMLAKDFVGTRQMYYFLEKDRVMWCTVLDPLLILAGRSFELNLEYIAGWLGFFPDASLTPYIGLHSVPPSSFVSLTREKQTVSKYWDLTPSKQIRYQSAADYEHHFCDVFSNSVRRRLRSDRPILAELSGGMDSSSIVCMADRLIGERSAEAPSLHTLSYYDNSEPNWNELPFVTIVENKRSERGCHLDASLSSATDRCEESSVSSLPGGATGKDPVFTDWLITVGSRTVLSGLGGDELLGGVPTPTPELQDLLVGLEFRLLFRQLKAWAMVQKRPWFYLLRETLREFAPLRGARTRDIGVLFPWLLPEFKRRFWYALSGYEPRITLTGIRPSFQQNRSTLEALRRHVACTAAARPTHEKCYPYLDRDLVEFCFAIPRDQLVRPGRRRFLQRNALRGIVPSEILERKRKSFVVRGPMTALVEESKRMDARKMISASLGIVDPDCLLQYLSRVRAGEEVAIVPLMRLLTIERWLSGFAGHLQASGKDSDLGKVANQRRSLKTARVQLALAE